MLLLYLPLVFIYQRLFFCGYLEVIYTTTHFLGGFMTYNNETECGVAVVEFTSVEVDEYEGDVRYQSLLREAA
jgi:hypothetical protein